MYDELLTIDTDNTGYRYAKGETNHRTAAPLRLFTVQTPPA